jgi:hypothetical protein
MKMPPVTVKMLSKVKTPASDRFGREVDNLIPHKPGDFGRRAFFVFFGKFGQGIWKSPIRRVA